MEDMQSQPKILRIKRKRTDEPLDALVIESRTRRKKSRGGAGFFQFAETVQEEAFWQDPNLTKDLRTRISTLVNGEVETASQRTERGANSPQKAEESPSRRYTIVNKGQKIKEPSIPVIHTASQLKATIDEDFTMYDAVPEPKPPAGKLVESPDPEMDKFLPMLEEYLRVNDVPSNISSASTKRDVGEEYVWDVFYHHPAMNQWAATANVATVSGLPTTQYDSESESESVDDEDDEDSNTEDFYRNDYPDDPDQDSDDSDALINSEGELSEEGEDERDLNAFLAWRGQR